MMAEDQVALTIARRTKKNLDFIYEQKENGADVEEFTQLLNSMLSMIICLREKYFNSKVVYWESIENIALQHISFEEFRILKSRTNQFNQLITRLRHAFSHNHIELLSELSPLGKNEIVGLKVWNEKTDKETQITTITWRDQFKTEQLKSIAYIFIEYLEETRGHELPLDKVN